MTSSPEFPPPAHDPGSGPATPTPPAVPATPPPAGQTPGAQPPAGQAPEWQSPSGQVPGAQPPAGQPPVGQPPAGQAPAAWAWAGQPQPMRTVETEPLEYHRLYRGVQGYRWWKPLIVLFLAGVFYLLMSLVLGVLFVPIMMAWDPGYATGILDGSVELLDTQRPVSLLVNLTSIIVMIPSVILAMLVMGFRPTSRVWSVALRIRWGLLGRVTGIAVLSVIAMNLAGIAFEFLLDPTLFSAPPVDSAAEFDSSAALLSLLLVLILVPFQATAEEVVFRGLFMQVLGSWLKNPWFAILIPSVGFALAHIYNVWGLLAVGLMGAVAAWLTWRTGGLEAAIAIHVINNLVAFGFMAAGFGGETAQTEDAGGPGAFVGEIVGLSLFIWLVVRTFRKHGYGRTRIDLKLEPAPVVPAAGPPTPGLSAPDAGVARD